jgi:hypothetical protein
MVGAGSSQRSAVSPPGFCRASDDHRGSALPVVLKAGCDGVDAPEMFISLAACTTALLAASRSHTSHNHDTPVPIFCRRSE